MSGAEKIAVRVTEVTPVNELVTRFRFERVDGGQLPTFSGGAHTMGLLWIYFFWGHLGAKLA